jgi:glycosyltransferase involved in cell wall biosynthesis
MIRDGVHYFPLYNWQHNYEPYDYIISSRVPDLPIENAHAKKILWVHDICFAKHGIECANLFDNIVLLSDWHREFWKRFGYDNKVVVIPDGLDTERFNPNKNRIYGKIVYSSSWDRGLDNLIYVLEQVRNNGGKVSLHVYYGAHNLIQSAKQNNNKELMGFYDYILDKFKQHDWIYNHDRVDQRTLAEEYERAFAWVYPTYFWETHCITATEAMAAGLPVIHNGLAGLAKYNDTGIVIPGDPSSIYSNNDAATKLAPYVGATLNLLRDPELWQELSWLSIKKAIQFRWENIVEEHWLKLLKE